MPVRINDALRNGMRDVLPMHDVTVSIYTGTQPSSANNAPTGTKLVEINGIYLTPTGNAGQLTLDGGPYQGTAIATGTAGWARLHDVYGNRVDTNVATSGAPMNISSTSIATNDLVVINSLTLTVPSG